MVSSVPLADSSSPLDGKLSVSLLTSKAHRRRTEYSAQPEQVLCPLSTRPTCWILVQWLAEHAEQPPRCCLSNLPLHCGARRGYSKVTKSVEVDVDTIGSWVCHWLADFRQPMADPESDDVNVIINAFCHHGIPPRCS